MPRSPCRRRPPHSARRSRPCAAPVDRARRRPRRAGRPPRRSDRRRRSRPRTARTRPAAATSRARSLPKGLRRARPYAHRPPPQTRRLAGPDGQGGRRRRLGRSERSCQPAQVDVVRHLVRSRTRDPLRSVADPGDLEHAFGLAVEVPADHVPAALPGGHPPRLDRTHGTVAVGEADPGTGDHRVPQRLERRLGGLHRRLEIGELGRVGLDAGGAELRQRALRRLGHARRAARPGRRRRRRRPPRDPGRSPAARTPTAGSGSRARRRTTGRSCRPRSARRAPAARPCPARTYARRRRR